MDEETYKENFLSCVGYRGVASDYVFLQKLYDRNLIRNAWFFRGQKQLKAAAESHGELTESGNPFVPRPSSSRTQSEAQRSLERAMDELDDEQHMPEGVEFAVWQRLVQARRQKLESEQQVSDIIL